MGLMIIFELFEQSGYRSAANQTTSNCQKASRQPHRYPTAWLMQQKLMQTMAERDALYHLEGHVQIDDAYLSAVN